MSRHSVTIDPGRVNALLREHHLTQKEASRLIGRSERWLETDVKRRRMNWYAMIDLASALGLKAGRLRAAIEAVPHDTD